MTETPQPEIPRRKKRHADLAALEWLDLQALTRYAALSERTLRELIHRPVNPLPASRVGSKLLVNKHKFDAWLEAQAEKPLDVQGIVEQLASELETG